MQGEAAKGGKDASPGRALSATFADLPAPELTWKMMATAPVPRLDGAAIQIKNLLFVFAGYGTIDLVRIFPCFQFYWIHVQGTKDSPTRF